MALGEVGNEYLVINSIPTKAIVSYSSTVEIQISGKSMNIWSLIQFLQKSRCQYSSTIEVQIPRKSKSYLNSTRFTMKCVHIQSHTIGPLNDEKASLEEIWGFSLFLLLVIFYVNCELWCCRSNDNFFFIREYIETCPRTKTPALTILLRDYR